jgi:putative tryptophan/tyrosine transport system substrate-binding protein
MVRSRRFVLKGLGASVAPLSSSAAASAPRVGFLVGASFPTMIAAFRGELARLGWVEGKTLILEIRQSRPNSSDLTDQATELVGMKLELIVAASLPAALEVRRLSPSTPLVIATAPGLVANGFARTPERPGGNATGMDELPPGLTGQRLTLLKTAAPHILRVALFSTTPGRGGHEAQLADAQAAAKQLGVQVTPYRVTTPAEVEPALGAIAAAGMDGLLTFQGALSLVNRQLIVDFAAGRRLAGMYQSTLFAEAGGLMAYSPDQEEQFREAARYVDRILKGAKPGDLPVKHPSRYFLTVNRAAAARIGLTLPQSLLVRADRVIG